MWTEIGIALLAMAIVALLLWIFTTPNKKEKADEYFTHDDGTNSLTIKVNEGPYPKSLDELDWNEIIDVDSIIMSGNIPIPKNQVKTDNFALMRPFNYDFANMIDMRTFIVPLDADFDKLSMESLEKIVILDKENKVREVGYNPKTLYQFLTRTKPLSIECNFLVPTRMFETIIEMEFLKEAKFDHGVSDHIFTEDYCTRWVSDPHIDHDKIGHLDALSIGYESKLNKSRKTTLLSIL